ncbi:hypothetical protein JW710_02055 [Candidatus Dojkabacteria bacterium]|nr:hypothetical protein [Candidatus Dojkabacteria bacterium]
MAGLTPSGKEMNQQGEQLEDHSIFSTEARVSLERFPDVDVRGTSSKRISIVGADGISVLYEIDPKEGAIKPNIGNQLLHISSETVLEQLPLSVDTFKIVNDISRDVLFGVEGKSPLERICEFKWGTGYIGGEWNGARVRLMLGSDLTAGVTGVRMFVDNPNNLKKSLPRFQSVLQILDHRGTLAVIDYPVAYRTVSSAAVIMEHLLEQGAPFSVGILGFGKTAKNLLFAIAALPRLPDRIFITAKGNNGYKSPGDRIEAELPELPSDILGRITPESDIDSASNVDVVYDLAGGYHALKQPGDKVKLFLLIAKTGAPKYGFVRAFGSHFFDAYRGNKDVFGTSDFHPFFTKEYTREAPSLSHVSTAPRGMLGLQNKAVICTVMGSPVIDAKIGIELIRRTGLVR